MISGYPLGTQQVVIYLGDYEKNRSKTRRPRISEDTYLRLVARQKEPNEPLDKIINRILDGDKRSKKDLLGEMNGKK